MLDIHRRRDLHDFVSEVVSHTYERLLAGERFDIGQALLKSYVVERHPRDDVKSFDKHSRFELLSEALVDMEAEVEMTEDPRLFLFDIPQHGEEGGSVSFAIDMYDDRYWQIHTVAKTTEADPIIRDLTQEGAHFDTAWLPGRYINKFSEQGNIFKVRVGFDDGALLAPIPEGRHQSALGMNQEGEWQLVESSALSPTSRESSLNQPLRREGGRSALTFSLRDYVDLRDGLRELQETRYFSGAMNITRAEFRYFWNGDRELFSNARLYNWGKITASGTSGDAHLDLMDRFVDDYRTRIERLEEELGCGDRDNDGAVSQPANIEYRRVEDFETFVFNMFSGTKPFRIGGVPRFRSANYAVVNAFDEHAQQPLRFEVTDSYMTVMLPPGGCGNTVARLYTNILQHFDANALLYGRKREDPFF